MLVNFVEAGTGKSIAINPVHVVCLFEKAFDDLGEKTIISMINGNVAVDESYIEVMGVLQGQLNGS
ncbi:hypothetical protein UFOVP250_172 [uncultured Caudovirales phage]|uniref:Uncharacterized protein n=1 Tax=uncultured Caudovirales phage TaxID=2100421 RepID=A0A6J5LK93_9CAUD|nr:hypothetical protein UFOVP250_172 [uncultured Caudovirales phage]